MIGTLYKIEMILGELVRQLVILLGNYVGDISIT